MDGRRVEIENDVFDIAARLREIDAEYFVVYDRVHRRFEVHHGRRGNTLALVCPYPVLDCRLIDLVQRTRVENADKLLREFEEHTLRLTGLM